MRDQFKQRKKKKNGLTNNIKLREVQDKMFEVNKTVPDLEIKTALTELEAADIKKKKREATGWEKDPKRGDEKERRSL